MHSSFYSRARGDHYWINKAAVFPSRINRISGFYFISSHFAQSRMIDPDDGGNINEETFQLFVKLLGHFYRSLRNAIDFIYAAIVKE